MPIDISMKKAELSLFTLESLSSASPELENQSLTSSHEVSTTSDLAQCFERCRRAPC